MPPPAATQAAARFWTARPELHTDPLATKLAECMIPPAGSVRWFTRGRVRELKNGHNSVTVQNRTHVYMNFFHHKDLGNHLLLQLCPKVVKHSVYGYFLNEPVKHNQPVILQAHNLFRMQCLVKQQIAHNLPLKPWDSYIMIGCDLEVCMDAVIFCTFIARFIVDYWNKVFLGNFFTCF